MLIWHSEMQQSQEPVKLTLWQWIQAGSSLAIIALLCLGLLQWCESQQTAGQKFRHKCERDYISRGQSHLAIACGALGDAIDRGEIKP